MNRTEATAVNTLLRWLLQQDPPTEDQARTAAEQLADRAHKALAAGYNADRVTAQWGATALRPQDDALAVVSGLEDLVRRTAKSSVRELDSELAHRIECLTGCTECGDHPDDHCDWCRTCPCACETA